MIATRKSAMKLAGIAAIALLAACSDQEQAEREADVMTERTEESIEQDPAMPTQEQGIPAPENVAAPPEDATTTDTGIAYVVLEDAAGDVHPAATDTITVHYTGWTTDGRMFDSSVPRGQPATFPLDQLIPGWQQAIPLMTVGDKYRFWIPGELAYDNSTRPGAPKGMLVFDIELLGIKKPADTADDGTDRQQ